MIKLMKLLAILASLALLGAACSSDDDDTSTADATEETTAETTEETTAETTEETTAEEESTEDEGDAMADSVTLTITAVSFTANTVTIRNDGADPVDLTGYSICNRPQYAAAPAAVIDPGATLDVDASELDIRGSGGEFGLYTSNSFDNADDMVAYVQWGSGDNGRASVAVAAGLIAEGDFVDNGGEDFTVG